MYNIPKKSNAKKVDREHFKNMNDRLKNYTDEQLRCDHELTKIAYKYRDSTDKCASATYWRKHNYTEFYGPLLNHLRDQPIRLLEIGVRWGGSIVMWKEFFPNGEIYGVDLNFRGIHAPLKKHMDWNRDDRGKGVNLIDGDAYSKSFADKHFSDIGFDVIIDDGSHKTEHQIKFFNIYRHFLSEGGYLMCEDIPSLPTAQKIINAFDGKINNLSLIDRTHNIPSGRDEIILLYKE